MRPILITFAGQIASGKTALSREVATSLGWPWASFGDYVRAEAAKREMDPTSRTALQQVSDQLLDAGWKPFCRAVLDQVCWVSGTNLVLDGIRHSEALSTLQELVSPQHVILVFVDTPDDVREERLRDRGISSQEQLIGEQHDSEQQSRTGLRGTAGIVVDGTQPLDEMVYSVLNWIADYVKK